MSRFDYAQRDIWCKEIRVELGCADNDFVYGVVGRITRDKGINELLEAYFSLHTDTKLFFIGRMEDVHALSAELLAKARKHPNIQFHDSVTEYVIGYGCWHYSRSTILWRCEQKS